MDPTRARKDEAGSVLPPTSPTLSSQGWAEGIWQPAHLCAPSPHPPTTGWVRLWTQPGLESQFCVTLGNPSGLQYPHLENGASHSAYFPGLLCEFNELLGARHSEQSPVHIRTHITPSCSEILEVWRSSLSRMEVWRSALSRTFALRSHVKVPKAVFTVSSRWVGLQQDIWDWGMWHPPFLWERRGSWIWTCIPHPCRSPGSKDTQGFPHVTSAPKGRLAWGPGFAA